MIITVINQKGGVGKTTTAVNLSYVLSKSKNVALLDMDPEGGSTTSFGMKREKKELEIGSKSVNIFNVEVFPAHLGLLKAELNGDVEDVVNKIKETAKNFDILVIDTPPNLGTLAVASMIAADKILSPVTPQPLALEAAKNLDGRLQSLNKKALAFTNLSNKAISLELSSVQFLNIHIPQSRLFIEASRLGVPATRYEEVRLKKPKLSHFFEELAKVTLE
ncbi:chromosome partitioning protein ParA [Acidianus hospitalis]|jgi:chromosome partitioning protein|uniref:Chromosome partitioning protein ParA n=1 Tax=Acidianus hospitalis TaxID=563177 RepID=A0A2T9X1N9_9CREN|nr:chromosome partitioning protein ParA [Acidianus hospitalis]